METKCFSVNVCNALFYSNSSNSFMIQIKTWIMKISVLGNEKKFNMYKKSYYLACSTNENLEFNFIFCFSCINIVAS